MLRFIFVRRVGEKQQNEGDEGEKERGAKTTNNK